MSERFARTYSSPLSVSPSLHLPSAAAMAFISAFALSWNVMNVYLLPHHGLDPRFRYTLEREGSLRSKSSVGKSPQRRSLWSRLSDWTRHFLRHLRYDYDHLVHGHEHIRLSKLLLLMDRDPELTIVVPAGMTREWSLKAMRGVIRQGLMTLRSYVMRNVSTAIAMMLILFGIIPTHVSAFLFYPLIGLYAWRRYCEDRLIRRIMNHLLETHLASGGPAQFHEDSHLAQLERIFASNPSAKEGYVAATEYLDRVDLKLDEQTTPELQLLYDYYRDIGRFDPYERWQDRVRNKFIETGRTACQHIFNLARAVFRPLFGTRAQSGKPVHRPSPEKEDQEKVETTSES